MPRGKPHALPLSSRQAPGGNFTQLDRHRDKSETEKPTLGHTKKKPPRGNPSPASSARARPYSADSKHSTALPPPGPLTRPHEDDPFLILPLLDPTAKRRDRYNRLRAALPRRFRAQHGGGRAAECDGTAATGAAPARALPAASLRGPFPGARHFLEGGAALGAGAAIRAEQRREGERVVLGGLGGPSWGGKFVIIPD